MTVRRLTRALLFLGAILLAGAHTGQGVKALPDCPAGWILCGAETINYDSSVHGTHFPGAYIESGQGTGRFGLSCLTSDYQWCFIYYAEWTGSAWSIEWAPWVGNNARHVWMNGNGNLQVFSASYSSLLWQTNTDVGETDAYLNVHDDSCAVIYRANDTAIWATCW